VNSPEQDQKIEQTENQSDCYRARPEDFQVSEPDEIASLPVPFHGQCGDTAQEYKRLLAIRASKAGKSKVTGKGVNLPATTDAAGKPLIGSRHS
jgi:hypothetical protein